jgi:AcrR family transcriptional regulator
MPKVVPEYKEEARKRILATATDLFLEKGYKQTKMTEIARELGVSKGALYQYYKSKDELLLQVIKSGSQFRRSSLFKEMSPEQLSHLSSIEYFTRMIRSTDQMNQLGVEIASAALHNKELMQGLRSFYQQEVDVVQEYFENLKEKELIKPEINTRVIALSILAIRTGLRGFMSTEENQEVINKTWRTMIELLIREIRE